ncbi:catechol 2,3-dioxygenase-like lactoylglutathione lyase family enzyme [Saccharothrix tamanrassetensis]|uniref:Catechol 2,3-dioxygenase-like lactoylglutathione lyase family enzyme n=1 Tax=Saccharothrix tamanrassetensis TaxID=1051531 RepID=A0A841CJ01_9PSEU|nr:VOC family protein [Saccharothrix tamanrassetensis]MBB5955985.1 catechol 2,3-dioxygenase-like lactoylglutathione lyase family enzyme [Saccharothrix tamanrassetensis]
MTIKLSHTFIQVLDQDEALAFYRDVVGLELRTDVPFDSWRWLSLSPPSQPDVEIVLCNPIMARSPEDAEVVRGLVAKGAMDGVIFRVDDLDATFERIRATGAEVVQEPIDQPYGVRDCAFRDPSGNQVRFASPKA